MEENGRHLFSKRVGPKGGAHQLDTAKLSLFGVDRAQQVETASEAPQFFAAATWLGLCRPGFASLG